MDLPDTAKFIINNFTPPFAQKPVKILVQHLFRGYNHTVADIQFIRNLLICDNILTVLFQPENHLYNDFPTNGIGGIFVLPQSRQPVPGQADFVVCWNQTQMECPPRKTAFNKLCSVRVWIASRRAVLVFCCAEMEKYRHISVKFPWYSPSWSASIAKMRNSFLSSGSHSR